MPQNDWTSQILRWRAACLLTVALATGCAHTATTTVWSPAQVEVSGMQKLAVLGFSGEQGNAVVSALHSRLWNNEFYSLVDQRASEPIRPVVAVGDASRLLALDDLDASRKAGIDGIVLGEVIEFRCEDHPLSNQERMREWLPQLGQHPPNSCKDEGLTAVSGSTLRRDATVTLAFRLIDVESGKIRVSKQISHSSTQLASDHSPTASTSTEALADLTRQCVDDFVSLLLPHQATQQVSLAEPALFQAGYSLVHNGNEFAIRGRWEEAMSTWKQALTCNPDNDAALFNLSIAHANRQDYTKAESFAIRAMNVRQKEMYQVGLQRVREQSAAYDQTLRQRRDLTAMAGIPNRE